MTALRSRLIGGLFAVLDTYLVIHAGVALLQLCFLPTRLLLRR